MGSWKDWIICQVLSLNISLKSPLEFLHHSPHAEEDDGGYEDLSISQDRNRFSGLRCNIWNLLKAAPPKPLLL